ncbi:MAG: proton-conducting transporter membrane subunit [Candidatus Latescibacterota bacterium]|jgi:hydrogenase-4 component F
MDEGWLLPALVALPAACAGVSLRLRSARLAIWFCAAGTLTVAGLAATAVWVVYAAGPRFAAGGWLMLDALSAYHLAVMLAVYSLSGLYGVSYFREEIEDGRLKVGRARRYAALWFGSLAAMMLVLLANNLGIMWVGIEATTLLTAFLICIHVSAGSLEAMWKYLLVCSVGVAIAFTGTVLIVAAAAQAGLNGTAALLWSNLREVAPRLDPVLLKAGFALVVVGYGTKAGLAPMHNWLPDAHSQAPAPVSAIFSGFLLNAALYCVLRYLPVVEAGTGQCGWGQGIMVVFGLLSITVAAIFIVAQHDLKRLLAYHSVEHLGIIALGVGVGGLGLLAALFHTLNHSLCKALSFFCAGSLGQVYGTHDMRRVTQVVRTSPVWGSGLVGSLLALIGVAPFSLFLSEFMILKAAVSHGAYWISGLFLAGIGVVFVGALRHAIAMAWDPLPAPVPARPARAAEGLLVFGPLAVLLVLGVWMPPPLLALLTRAAGLLGGGS